MDDISVAEVLYLMICNPRKLYRMCKQDRRKSYKHGKHAIRKQEIKIKIKIK